MHIHEAYMLRTLPDLSQIEPPRNANEPEPTDEEWAAAQARLVARGMRTAEEMKGKSAKVKCCTLPTRVARVTHIMFMTACKGGEAHPANNQWRVYLATRLMSGWAQAAVQLTSSYSIM